MGRPVTPEAIERKRIRDREYRLNNKEKIKAYSSVRNPTRQDAGYYRDYYRRPGVAIKRQLIQAKARAKRQDIPFDITLDDIVVPEFCPVLGIRLEQGERGNPSSPSLDKIIPSKGYVKGNVRVISNRANKLKNDGTLEELKAVVAYIEREMV